MSRVHPLSFVCKRDIGKIEIIHMNKPNKKFIIEMLEKKKIAR